MSPFRNSPGLKVVHQVDGVTAGKLPARARCGLLVRAGLHHLGPAALMPLSSMAAPNVYRRSAALLHGSRSLVDTSMTTPLFMGGGTGRRRLAA